MLKIHQINKISTIFTAVIGNMQLAVLNRTQPHRILLVVVLVLKSFKSKEATENALNSAKSVEARKLQLCSVWTNPQL